MKKKKILFICFANVCRSIIAEAMAKFYGGEKVEAFSGGVYPARKISKNVVRVMEEKNIDVSNYKPKHFDEVLEKNGKFDIIILMGKDIFAKNLPAGKTIVWDIKDSSSKNLQDLRKIRDNIEKKVLSLLSSI